MTRRQHMNRKPVSRLEDREPVHVPPTRLAATRTAMTSIRCLLIERKGGRHREAAPPGSVRRADASGGFADERGHFFGLRDVNRMAALDLDDCRTRALGHKLLRGRLDP